MWRRPTLPGVTPVPSALQGLTSLFGMGRGGTPALGRLVFLYHVQSTVYHVFPVTVPFRGKYLMSNLCTLYLVLCTPIHDMSCRECNRADLKQVFGLLVLLGFVITDFAPAAYRRHRL